MASTWVLRWGDRVWAETDLTGAHVAVIVKLAGADDWGLCNPLAGPGALMGVLAAFITLDEHKPVEVALRELSRAKALDLLAAVTTLDLPDDDGPDGGVAAVVPPPPAVPARPKKQKVGAR